MRVFKLGCNWGRNSPVFFDWLEDKEFILSVTDYLYPIGSIILITEGYTVKALAYVVGSGRSITERNDLQEQLTPYQIPFVDYVLIYENIQWFSLDKEDQFRYALQGGIREVQKSEIQRLAQQLYKKYTENMAENNLKDLLKFKKQIILQGPPGTGKTYTAKDIAEKIIFGSISTDKKMQATHLKNSDQFEIIQFHPSYSYEDFIRGIATQEKEGSIIYQVEDKTLLEFIERAKQFSSSIATFDYSESESVEEAFSTFIEKVRGEVAINDSYKLTNNVSIVEVEDNAFRYTGGNWENQNGTLLYFDKIINAYRNNVNTKQQFKELPDTRTGDRSTYYVKIIRKFREFIDNNAVPSKRIVDHSNPEHIRPYVFVIDEINRGNLPSLLGELIYALEYRDEEVQSMYALDGDASIWIPSNVYIIGTMNTADRSVGHIDYAIRRRFAFVDVLPDRDVVPEGRAREEFDKVASLFVNSDNKRSEHLALDFAPEQVQIGHSYFLSETDDELGMKIKYEVVPILKEYVRDGVLLESANKTINELGRD